MKLENMKPVIELAQQLEGIENAVIEAKNMVEEVAKGAGITISEHSDGSGNFNIDPLYVNGNHDTATLNKIAEAVLVILEDRRAEILSAIDAIK